MANALCSSALPTVLQYSPQCSSCLHKLIGPMLFTAIVPYSCRSFFFLFVITFNIHSRSFAVYRTDSFLFKLKNKTIKMFSHTTVHIVPRKYRYRSIPCVVYIYYITTYTQVGYRKCEAFTLGVEATNDCCWLTIFIYAQFGNASSEFTAHRIDYRQFKLCFFVESFLQRNFQFQFC